MKKRMIVFAAFMLAAVMTLPSFARAASQSIPNDVQEYAEGPGFQFFLNNVGSMGYVDLTKVTLGEGFTLYSFKSDLSSDSIPECLRELDQWEYLINAAEGGTVGHMRVSRSENGEMSSWGGGGVTSDFSNCVQKMRELIRKSGGDGDVTVINYGYNSFLLYYSFGGDERVIDVVAQEYGKTNYLNATDYHQLPTGIEAIQAMRDEVEYIRQEMEKNGGQPLYGGIDLKLQLHEYSPGSNAILIIAVAAPLLLIGILAFSGRRRRASAVKTA